MASLVVHAGGRVIAGTTHAGVFVFQDEGDTWIAANFGLPRWGFAPSPSPLTETSTQLPGRQTGNSTRPAAPRTPTGAASLLGFGRQIKPLGCLRYARLSAHPRYQVDSVRLVLEYHQRRDRCAPMVAAAVEPALKRLHVQRRRVSDAIGLVDIRDDRISEMPHPSFIEVSR
jgi:hypothetical protein